MNPASGTILSLAYIFALLSTSLVGLPSRNVPWQEYSLLILGAAILGILAAIAIPRFWRRGPKPRLWLIAGIVAALAIAYCQTRIPQPTASDISKFVPADSSTQPGQVVTVQGNVETMPRLTRSGKGQFWLAAQQLNEVESSSNQGAISSGVTGKLYVTVPLLQATGIYPGAAIAITGILYKPLPVSNPGAFNFPAYLAREGAFAGLSGRQVNTLDEQAPPKWGWWQIQQRITRAQVQWLGSPVGQLVSSMVLGNRAVDIPYDIRDQFIGAGLAHALAASGTQTSLILGVIVALTRRFGAKAQLICGTLALVIFLCLTGWQAAVLRAGIMGWGALFALVTERKVKPLGSLLVAGTILLIINPLWIWDLGFQLSFLATLGLLVTVPPLTKHLDWLPTTIASLIAIPLAASLWTLPLQLYVFGMVAPYSIAANIVTGPLIALISLGGFISALAALISPVAGSAIAWLLNYPTQLLIGLIQFFNNLPGNNIAVGTIALWQLLLLYGLISITAISSRLRTHWGLAILVAITVVVLPVWQTHLTQFQVTVLSSDQEQVLVIQNQGQVTLVNSGEADTATFTVLPFLQQQGVNQIDWAIAVDSEPSLRSGWVPILESLPIRAFYDLTTTEPTAAENQGGYAAVSRFAIATAVQSQQGTYQLVSTGQKLSVGRTVMQLVNPNPPILQLQIQDQGWLFLGKINPDQQQQLAKFAQSANLPPTQVLWWSGEPLAPELVGALKPKVAIASSDIVDLEAAKLLQKTKTQIYWTGRDGAIQWTPNQGFETTLEASSKDAALL